MGSLGKPIESKISPIFCHRATNKNQNEATMKKNYREGEEEEEL